MLSPDSKRILDDSLTTILHSPQSLTQNSFVSTYNTVYTFCSAPSDSYHIEGESIFQLIEQRLEEYTRSIQFIGTIGDFSRSMIQFKQTAQLLTKVYSYLERFYVRTAMFNKMEILSMCSEQSEENDASLGPMVLVEPLADLFYRKLYFNYLSYMKDNIFSLVFSELNVYRMNFRQSCNELRQAVAVYTQILLKVGQESTLKRFHQGYLQSFVASTDFRADMGKLLKRVYLEMFYATNIIGEKAMCREIVSYLDDRTDDMLEYTFSKIKVYEPVRHVFKILNIMDEVTRNKLKVGYEEIIKERLSGSAGFGGLYDVYCKTVKQIRHNKMAGWMEILNDLLKSWVANFSLEKSRKLTSDCAEAMDEHLRSVTSDSEESITVPSDLIDFSALLDCDLFANLYSRCCQQRLLTGLSPKNEQNVLKELVKRFGPSSLAHISRFISNYLLPTTVLYPVISGLCSPEGATVTLVKHTAGFWPMRPSTVSLPLIFQEIMDSVIAITSLDYHECIHLNLRLSPIVVEINETIFKMNTDTFSLLYHIYSGVISIQELEKIASDQNFTQNLQKLINNSLIEERNGMVMPVDYKSEKKYVDLFEVVTQEEKNEYRSVGSNERDYALEATICRILKKEKEITLNYLYELVDEDRERIFECVSALETRGYLLNEEGNVKYIP